MESTMGGLNELGDLEYGGSTNMLTANMNSNIEPESPCTNCNSKPNAPEM